MQTPLEKLSKKALIALVKEEQKAVLKAQQEGEQQLAKQVQEYEELNQQHEKQLKQASYYEGEITYLKTQLEQYKRLVHGQKRERFEGNANQLALPFENTPLQEEAAEEQLIEKVAYVRKKQKSAHKGRTPLPEHLPVEEIEIYPKEDISGMKCIGKEVTEELECVPEKFYIKRYIRYKYADKNEEGVAIAELPERVIDKGIPGPALLATIITDKYVDHLPLHRQKQRFKRAKIPIASSTLEGWNRQGLDRVEIIYQHLVEDTKRKGYIQADETTIKVVDSNKKGACHQGYYWVYHSPIDGTVLFDYQPTRGAGGAASILSDFSGYLQTDGYGVYDKIGRRPEVTHLSCWAHARREFDKALSNDKDRATTALMFIQRMYNIEREARDQALSPEARTALRLEKSLLVINSLGMWLAEEVKKVLPKSQIGKAMQYTMARWDNLSAYLYDGILEIDNNLVENAIRPVALGRKNYLFAGSHQAAQRAAMIYSFFATCKKHDVNPYEWLKYTLENIMTINHKNIRDLYPQNFKKING